MSYLIWRPFWNYYLKIGLSRFYIIISELKDFERIKVFLKDYEPYLEYSLNKDLQIEKCFDLTLKNLKEDYILNVDVDEFLEVAPHETIQDYIAATGCADKYTFGWLLNVNDDLSKNTDAFEGKSAKQMCKRSLIKSIHNHSITPLGKVIEAPRVNILIHYWGRTFDDMIIKCIYGAHKDRKTTSLERMNKDVSNNRIPNRFKMMAVLSRRIKTIHVQDYVTDKINYPLEAELAAPFKQKEKLIELYKKYMENLDYDQHVAIYGDVNLIQLIDYLP